MKYFKSYLCFAVIVIVAVIFKFHNTDSGLVRVEAFRGAQLEEKVWNPMIASNVNGKLLTVAIDNREIDNQDENIFMNDDLSLMIPVSNLRDSFDCSAHIYNQKELLLEKRNDQIELYLDQASITINDVDSTIASAMTEIDGEYYVPMEAVSTSLGYSYNWDVEKNVATAINASQEESGLPYAYDLRKTQRTSVIRDQGQYGTCWAFAALSAVESVLLPEESLQFSVDHMSMSNSFSSTQYDGGDYTMGMAYLTAWQGPVLEADDPYGDGVSDDTLSAVKHVQQIQIIEDKDLQKIKEAVFKYGGVQTSLYSTLKSSQTDTPYYNRAENAYCYIGTSKPNHDVVIVGWDDSYPGSNFTTQPEGDGAFICQNSWGADFGDAGMFYVSYYDTNIGLHNVVYTDIEDADNYDHIYQSDLTGWAGQIGYNEEGLYGANIYTADGNEKVEAAGFYATGKDTEYQLYVVKDFTDTSSLKNKKQVASGTLSNVGYYTIDFDEAVSVEAGERYAIILYIKTPSSVHPLAIEYENGEFRQDIDLADGEGYISSSGENWEHVEETQDCNICLKAYTSDR